VKASGATLDPSGQSLLISNDAGAQGFTIIEAVLDGTEVAELAQALETSDLDRSRAGARHLMNHPVVSAVAADSRMVAIAGRFLGGDGDSLQGDAIRQVPARNWLVA
jgi:hypothetical protein